MSCNEFYFDDVVAITAIPVTDVSIPLSVRLKPAISYDELVLPYNNAVTIGVQPINNSGGSGVFIPMTRSTGKVKDEEGDSVAGRLHTVTVTCEVDDRESTVWQHLLTLERTPAHLLLSFRSAAAIVAATKDAYMCTVERSGGKTSLTFRIQDIMGLQHYQANVGSFYITGDTTFSQPGTYSLTVSPTDPAMAISDIQVTLSGGDIVSASVDDAAHGHISVTVNKLPYITTAYSFIVTVTDTHGAIYTISKEITVECINATGASLSGPSTISKEGTYQYQVTDIVPADHSDSIIRLTASVNAPIGYPATIRATSTTDVVLQVGIFKVSRTLTITVVALFDSGNTINITKDVEVEGYFVDLKLPSRNLWAKGNIIEKKTQSGKTYTIGEPTDYGTLLSWENIVAQTSTNGITLDDDYSFRPGTNALTPGAFHMPSERDIEELMNNTLSHWTVINNVAGIQFVAQNGKSIFMPAAGYGLQDDVFERGSRGCYWLSTIGESDDTAYAMTFSSSGINAAELIERYKRLSIRPVSEP